MIMSAEEFVSLRDSDNKTEYDRSAMEPASLSVWYEVIEKYPEYRKWVAHNKTVPIEILEALSSCDSETRWFVAGKRKLSPELFRKLSQDPCPAVRSAIASNRKAPLELVKTLIKDIDKDVSEVAKYNYELRRPAIESGASGEE